MKALGDRENPWSLAPVPEKIPRFPSDKPVLMVGGRGILMVTMKITSSRVHRPSKTTFYEEIPGVCRW